MQNGQALWAYVDEQDIALVESVIGESNVNYRDSNGQTALHRAALRLFPAAIRLLILHGADVNAVDKNGRAALHNVKPGDPHSIVCMLLLYEAGADVKLVDFREMSPLHTNVSRNRYQQNCVTDLQFLIKIGCDIEGKDRHGQTPLQLTAVDGLEQVAKILLENDADPNTRDDRGNTPLFLRQSNTHPGTGYVILLLKHGANIHVCNNVGDSPLHVACARHRSVTAWVQALLRSCNFKDRNAYIDFQNNDGDTSLHKCSVFRWTEVPAILLREGADIDIINVNGYMPGNQPHHLDPIGALQEGTHISNMQAINQEALRRERYSMFCYEKRYIPAELFGLIFEIADS